MFEPSQVRAKINRPPRQGRVPYVRGWASSAWLGIQRQARQEAMHVAQRDNFTLPGWVSQYEGVSLAALDHGNVKGKAVLRIVGQKQTEPQKGFGRGRP